MWAVAGAFFAGMLLTLVVMSLMLAAGRSDMERMYLRRIDDLESIIRSLKANIKAKNALLFEDVHPDRREILTAIQRANALERQSNNG